MGVPQIWGGGTAAMSISGCPYPRPDCQEERGQGLCYMKSDFHPIGVGVLEALGPWLCCPPRPGPELGPSILNVPCYKGSAGC